MKKLLTLICVVCGLLCAAADSEFESGRGSRVEWARLKFNVTGDRSGPLGWFHHPTGDINLIDFLRNRTDINISYQWNIVAVGNLEHMSQFPLIFASGLGRIVLNKKEKSNIREYLLRGGMLFIDDCVAKPVNGKHDIFFTSFKNVLTSIIPEIEMRKIETSHPIFHCYYDLPSWVHIQGTNNGLWGAWYEDRLVAVLDSSDLHCGWVGFQFSQDKREFALKMAANIYVYAMTY